jgi:ribosomal protein S18 acetylase RimI-like enzyme
MAISVRPITDRDFFPWHELYEGYGEFYNTPLTDHKAVLIWSWLIDHSNELEALVAVDDDNDGKLLGLAHFRKFARPLAGGIGLYIDDLYVSPTHRENGIGTALINEVKAIAAARKAGIVRWITAEDNTDAQRLYDSVAERTSWVTYDSVV